MRSHAALGVAISVVAPALAASGSGKSTRYWDCCKPSCAWPNKASVSHPPYTCDKSDSPLSDFSTKSGCESGGSAYTCTNQSPWALNDLVSYGFAATAISGGTESSWCCACYALTFTSGKAKGKKMVVQSINTGGDLGDNHFDIQMPGGGLGIFDGCTSQFGSLPGARYGGISKAEDCDVMPAKLQAGCKWRFNWFNNADNPTHEFTQVSCPDELIARSGCRRSDDANFPKFVMPSVTTWSPPAPTGMAEAFGQCDNLIWDGPKACPSGYYCKYVTDYFWQCAQGTDPNAGSSPAVAGGASTTVTTGGGGDTGASSSLNTTTGGGANTQTTTSGGGGGGTAALYGQCGPTPELTCSQGTCKKSNQYYWQCVP